MISEKEELKKKVKGLVWYSPRKEELGRYGSGGVAIIDQWIASHAKYFIGKMGSCTCTCMTFNPLISASTTISLLCYKYMYIAGYEKCAA